ncbi:MAG: SDR family oxidoreductase [Rhizobacter sp.]|nr:SDR family oxidoreductase [Chlorobiales bacterium]
MNLLIFGATGGTGKVLLQQALDQNHRITALVRNPDSVTASHPNLTVVKGDISDSPSLLKVMPNQEAVLSALGVKVLKSNTVLSDGTANILRAMSQFGIKRFICETSLGLGDSKDQMGFFFGKIVVPFFLKSVFVDKERQEKIIMESNAEWIIVRPGGLTDGPRTGIYRSGLSKDITGQISRADVADFMLKQLSSATYIRKTPAISY